MTHRLNTARRSIAAVGTAIAVAVVLASVASGAGTGAAKLAFVVNAKSGKTTVWVADASGHNARKLGAGEFPLISPNGQLVAAGFFGRAGSGVVIYHSGGGTLGKFVKDGSPLAWSADSRYLAVSVFDAVAHGVGKSQLAVVDVTTGKTVTIVRGFISGASFSPNPTDDSVVYGLSTSTSLKAPVDLYTADPTGVQPPVQITHDGHSLNPLWTKRGFVFDRERFRKLAPEYQLYELRNGHTTQITNIKVDKLSAGLSPVAASADGTRIAAEYGGQDNSEGWAVNVVTHKAKELATPRNGLVDAGITRDGKTLLVDLGIFGGDPSNPGTVATIPFGGGKPHKLIPGNSPSWNR
jgi:hypothetical protein